MWEKLGNALEMFICDGKGHFSESETIASHQCALRNEHFRKKETLKQQQSREDHEKKLPTKKCKVYVWRWDRDSGYTCESICQSENEEELDFYGRNQRVYNAFFNCWDLCNKFGAVEPDEFNVNNDVNSLVPPCEPPSIESPLSHAPLTPHSQFLAEPSFNPLLPPGSSTSPASRSMADSSNFSQKI
jgi:hypothetical protein